MSEADVIREALGLPSRHGPTEFWESEGVKFPVGTVLEHRFRDGTIARARITADGVEVDGRVYSGLSAAGTAVTGHNLNGWRFWFVRADDGSLAVADALRTK